jgi:hypothetical protein
MLIILEGPDCAGKTTFAERLAVAIQHAEPDSDVTLFHRGPPQVHPLDEYVAPLLDYRPGTNRHVVCDRWHVGESIYPALFDRHTDMTADVELYVELFLRSRGALLVYCDATDEHLTACGVARGANATAFDAIATDAARLYRRYVTRTLLPSLTVNVSDPTRVGDADVADVVDFAIDEEYLAEPLNPFTTYIGPHRPQLLLFGDRRGPASVDLSHYAQWPAFVPRPSTSGCWLLTTLLIDELRVPSHRLLLNQVGIANACDVDDPFELWSTLGKPETIALGTHAHRMLDDLGVAHRHIAHPQYYRRFKHNDRRDYFNAVFSPKEITA